MVLTGSSDIDWIGLFSSYSLRNYNYMHGNGLALQGNGLPWMDVPIH